MTEVHFAVLPVPILYGDNTAANSIASNASSVRKVRHLLLPQLFLRTLTRDGRLEVRYKSTHEMTADFLTKILPEQKIEIIRRLIQLL